MGDNLNKRLQVATEVAWRAGRSTLKYFQTGVAVQTKEDDSPVTVADREAEEILLEGLRREFPADGFLGEESGVRPGDSGFDWIVDPIDGTKSFIHGVPLYGVMVALRDPPGDIVLGIVCFPALGDLVTAARGEGCQLNGRVVRVSPVESLQEATVSLTSLESFRRTDTLGALQVVWERSGLLRGWGDCYGHVLVATGRIEAMLDPEVADWDCAALLPILEEAGGVFTDWDGNRTYQGGSAVSSNRNLAVSLREAIQNAGGGERLCDPPRP